MKMACRCPAAISGGFLEVLPFVLAALPPEGREEDFVFFFGNVMTYNCG
jgi:hypothetical protein